MPMIIYPATGADSFVTVQQADLYISLLTMNSAEWTAIAPDDKERLLRIAFRDIIDHTDPTTYPTPLPACVGESQAMMAIHDSINNLSSGVVNTSVTGALKKQKVGSIERQFYDTKSTKTGGKVYRVPDAAWKCLSTLGYALKTVSDKFQQSTLGHS